MNKQEKINLIKDHIVIRAISPWDGEAIFDNYSVIIHKYDNEDLSFINDNDPRIAGAAERIYKLIDTNDWDQLVNYYLSVKTYTQLEGERKPIPRGGRKKEEDKNMIKYSVTFSTNRYGSEKTEEDVKNLTVQLLEAAGIQGATLCKNLAGVWQGQTEDSYTLVILSDNDITVKVEALALNLKVSLNQQSVMVEKSLTDAKFL